MHVRAALPHELSWLVERVGCHLTPDAKGACAVGVHGAILGMAVFDWWTGNSAMAHLAADSPLAIRALRRVVLPEFFRHRRILLGLVRASNTKALRVDKELLGFREVCRVKDGADEGEDLVMLELRREDWLSRKENQHGHS